MSDLNYLLTRLDQMALIDVGGLYRDAAVALSAIASENAGLRKALQEISELGHDSDNTCVPYEAKIADRALAAQGKP